MSANPDTKTNDGPFSDIRAQRIIWSQVKRCLDKNNCVKHPDSHCLDPEYEFVESSEETIGDIDNSAVYNQQWSNTWPNNDSSTTLSWTPEINVSAHIGDNFRYLLEYNNARNRINDDEKVESADNNSYLHKNLKIRNYSRMMVELSDGRSAYYVFLRVKAIVRKDDYSYGIVCPGEYYINHGFMTNDCGWQHEMYILHKTAYEILEGCEKEGVIEVIDWNETYDDEFDEKYPSDDNIIATVKLLSDNSYWVLVTFRF